MKRYRPIIVLLIIILGLVACAGSETTIGSGNGVVKITDASGQTIAGDAVSFVASGMAPIEGPAAVDAPTDNVLMLDGELVTVQPALPLAFPANVKGTLLQIHVELGQPVRQGDLIATLDDAELQKAVQEAELALERAQDDRAREQAKREGEYQKAVADAQRAYDTAQIEAETALRNAKSALEQALLKPPTLSLKQAEVKLERVQDAEAAAADRYKQALDCPWEPQQIRDELYKEWQRQIVDRQLAEMELEIAQIDVQAYNLDLADKRLAVSDAQAKLDNLQIKEIVLDIDYTSYDRAIADAEATLAQAEQNLAWTHLYAPWDGTITEVKAAVGTNVGGETAIVKLLNVTDLYFVSKNLSEKHIAQIESGQMAHITLRAFPEQTLTGQVETVLANSETDQEEQRFAVYIRLDPGALHLLPGMTGRVEILESGTAAAE